MNATNIAAIILLAVLLGAAPPVKCCAGATGSRQPAPCFAVGGACCEDECGQPDKACQTPKPHPTPCAPGFVHCEDSCCSGVNGCGE